MPSHLNRKEFKRKSRQVVKSHYLLLLFTCLLSAVVGSEFTDAVGIVNVDTAVLQNIIQLPSAILEGGERVFGLSNGVFATLVNGFASGTIYDTILSAVNTFIGSEMVGTIIFISLSLALLFAGWFFIGNLFAVVNRRIFLESRLYKTVPPQRFLFLFYIKKWPHVASVMFVTYLYNALWFLVFGVMGVVKHYSYFLVPYLLAENPNLTAKEAITLSRQMMDGHKWECFLLDLSFFGWAVLRIVTFGLSGLFYSNAYLVGTYTEYYVALRALAKEKNIAGADLLQDTYLYQTASTAELRTRYADIVTILEAPKTTPPQKGKVETLLNFFGIALHRTKLDDRLERQVIDDSYAKGYEDILAAKEYPFRLFTITARVKADKGETNNYMKRYTIPTFISFFFLFSFVGWLWEVALFFVERGEFINRGTLHGPWLPIYGSGGLLILILLYPFRKKPLVQFGTAVVLCGIIEYFTAYFLELTHDGQKWWDYSGYFLNLHGRICGEGLLVFGLGGVAAVYLLAPLLDRYISKVKYKILVPICAILVVCFVADAIYSGIHPNAGEGITSMSIKPVAPTDVSDGVF